MFVQVIQGRVSDATRVRQGLDDWMARLAEGAEGWLGSTAGVTDDGTFIAIARFDSAEAARRNSGRAEQGEWWSGMSKLFADDVIFHDCSEVVTVRAGGSDDAGFVQVMQGRTGDLARLREVDAMFEQRFPTCAPSCSATWSACTTTRTAPSRRPPTSAPRKRRGPASGKSRPRRPPSCCGRRWSSCRTWSTSTYASRGCTHPDPDSPDLHTTSNSTEEDTSV